MTSKIITELNNKLSAAQSKAEDLRDAIASEIDEAGENASEDMQNDLSAVEDVEGYIQSAIDALNEQFAEAISKGEAA